MLWQLSLLRSSPLHWLILLSSLSVSESLSLLLRGICSIKGDYNHIRNWSPDYNARLEQNNVSETYVK